MAHLSVEWVVNARARTAHLDQGPRRGVDTRREGQTSGWGSSETVSRMTQSVSASTPCRSAGIGTILPASTTRSKRAPPESARRCRAGPTSHHLERGRWRRLVLGRRGPRGHAMTTTRWWGPVQRGRESPLPCLRSGPASADLASTLGRCRRAPVPRLLGPHQRGCLGAGSAVRACRSRAMGSFRHCTRSQPRFGARVPTAVPSRSSLLR